MAKVIDLFFLIRLDICVAIEQKEQGWCLLTDFGFFFIRFRELFPPKFNLWISAGAAAALRRLRQVRSVAARWNALSK